jgi:hypothetical protein
MSIRANNYLKKFLNKLSKERTGVSMNELLESLTYGMEKVQSSKTLKPLWMPTHDSDHFYRVVYSDMQTGKTAVMASAALFVAISLKMPVFLFVQNRKADLKQLQSRLADFWDMWHAEKLPIKQPMGKRFPSSILMKMNWRQNWME